MRMVRWSLFWGTSLLFCGALSCQPSGTLLGFLQPIAFPVDRENLGAMHEPVDQGNDGGCVWEYLVPFLEHLVSRNDGGPTQLVASVDDFKEQIGIAGVVGEVPHFVQPKNGRGDVTIQPACDLRGTVLGGQIMEHVGSG